MLQHLLFGICYCQVADGMATAGWVTNMVDVITKVADGIATRVCLFWVLRHLTEPHPICMADGICLYFCLGMDCWPLYIDLLWCFYCNSGPPSSLCWNYLYWCCDQLCYNGHILGKGLLMFLVPLSKCFWWFTNIFLITLHPVTFVSLDDSTFLKDGIFVLWSHQEILDDNASFEVDLYPMFAACSL